MKLNAGAPQAGTAGRGIAARWGRRGLRTAFPSLECVSGAARGAGQEGKERGRAQGAHGAQGAQGLAAPPAARPVRPGARLLPPRGSLARACAP